MLHIYEEITKTSPGKRGWELPQCFILWSTCPKYSPVHFRKSHFFSRRISTGSCTSCHCCPSLAPETQPQFHSKNSHAQAVPAHQAHGVVQRAGTPKTQSSAPSSVTYSLDSGWGNPPRLRIKPTTLSPKRSKFPIRAAANSGSQQEESFLKRYNPGFLC